jgi:hypothetical protein
MQVLRVVANASLNELLGPELVNSPEVLLTVYGVLNSGTASQELLLGALLTLNNLSFYPSADLSRLAQQQVSFAQTLIPILLNDKSALPLVIEALRVFGNFTRWKESRDLFHQGARESKYYDNSHNGNLFLS